MKTGRITALVQQEIAFLSYAALIYSIYRNFRPITRTADYPQRSIFVVRGKKVQQITRTGLLPAPQNKRKSCYCITGIRTHKHSVLLFTKRKIDNIFCQELAVNNAALNTLLRHFWFVLLKRPKYQCINAKTR